MANRADKQGAAALQLTAEIVTWIIEPMDRAVPNIDSRDYYLAISVHKNRATDSPRYTAMADERRTNSDQFQHRGHRYRDKDLTHCTAVTDGSWTQMNHPAYRAHRYRDIALYCKTTVLTAK